MKNRCYIFSLYYSLYIFRENSTKELYIYIYIYIYYIYCDGKIGLKSPKRGLYFSHVWRRGRLALDPLWNKSLVQSFFSQAYKKLAYYVRDWFRARLTAAGKGVSKISHYHTPTRPLNFFPLDNRRIQTYRS